MIKGELAERVAQLASERVPFVIATVVRARRPTSVRPGDSAVVLGDGTIEGFVGGLCAESSVRLYSLRALETGEPSLLRLVPPGSDAGGDSIEGAIVEHNPCLSGGALEIFLEPQLPAVRIVVVGTSPIARAVERVGVAAGFDVVRGAAVPAPTDAALVVASHGDEEGILAEALTAGVPYVALVASPKRGAAVRAALDIADELKDRLHTPAGLDIGARTPEEVAISILAEVIAEHHMPPVRAAALATATDPVCGMEMVVSGSTPSLDVDGGTVYFCCAGCRDAYAVEHGVTS